LCLGQRLERSRLRSGGVVVAVRQIEIAELMVAADNYSAGYVEALILGTPKDQLSGAEKPRKPKGVSPENTGRMKQEMETLERDLKAIEAGYWENVLNLTLASAYIRKLLDNVIVARFLKAGHADLYSEFEKIAATGALQVADRPVPMILFIFY
jgi:hypothetical protein